MNEIEAVKARHGERLLRYPNVTGVGIGLRMVGGQHLPETCLRVYVRRKVPEHELRPDEVLPRRLNGVVVDVVEGEFDLLGYGAPPLSAAERASRRFPFTEPGVSVGGLRITAGTLGATVYDTFNGRQLLLSNWHVLCGAAVCAPGEAIVQPGPFDGGTDPADRIGTLVRYTNTDRVDAAVAEVSWRRFLSEAIAGIGVIRGTAPAVLGTPARKSGRTTGLTSGLVDDVSADVNVGGKLFRGQLVVRAPNNAPVLLTAGGDSGSLTVDDRDRAIGLLFAGARGGGNFWIANPIAEVIAALDIRFTPEPAPLQSLTMTTLTQ